MNSGQKHKLRVAPMSPDASSLSGEGEVVFEDPKRHHTIEGPKFLKRAGWYYILAPAGGVATGWQTVLRSRNIFGPYEDKIVLHQGNTPVNGPHQGGLVDTQNGAWWFLHFQDTGVYGRVVHLQPVEWRDGWPLMGARNGAGAPGEPVLQHRKPILGHSSTASPPTSDEFDSPNLGLQWQWNANHLNEWFSLCARSGWLRLFAQPAGATLAECPNLLLQKFPARSFSIATLMEFKPMHVGEEAGVVIMGNSHAAVGLRSTASGLRTVVQVDGKERILGNPRDCTIELSAQVSDGGKCRLGFLDTGGFSALAEDFQAREGKWIGARVGLYCTTPAGPGSGQADFNYFRFSSMQ